MNWAVWLAVVSLGFTALFQMALMLGAPLGEYAFGGQHRGRLPIGFRIGSAISALVYLGIAGHYLAQIGLFNQLLPDALNSLVNWGLVGLNVVSLILNSISRSKLERKLWVPVILLLLTCSVFIALG
ncbi:MAG: hypothetical protein RIR16_397 [Actinomycetota bacterium]|jgi:hypothetical protein